MAVAGPSAGTTRIGSRWARSRWRAGLSAAGTIAVCLLPCAAHAQSAPTIGGYQLVQTVRVTRTVSEFTYRATLTGGDQPLAGATATLVSLSPNTTIVDGALAFGAVAAGGTVASSDTFSFRHTLTTPFTWANVQWTLVPQVANRPPTITAQVTPAPNAAGWHNGPVTVTFTCADPDGNVASCPTPIVVTTDGQGQVITGTVTDTQGATASASVTLDIDRAPPLLQVALDGPSAGASLFTGPVTATFTCTDALSGVTACPAPQTFTTAGTPLTASATITDLAGNSASVTSPPFTIQLLAPAISVTLTPAANAAGWHNGPVTAHFTCTLEGAPLAGCPADQVVSTEGTGLTVTGSVSVNGQTVSVTSDPFNIDVTPPLLNLTTPANGTTVFTPTVRILGTASDSLSGLASATCGVAPATVTADGLECVVSLSPGANGIDTTVFDVAGNASTVPFGLVHIRVPSLTLSEPRNLSYFNISPITVTGTVDDPTATVVVNTIPAAVVNGVFSVAVPLAEGQNVVTATASTASATSATASVSVTLDTTTPRVTILSPPNDFQTTDSTISVAGSVNDIVVGTVNEEQAQVTVNGMSASVANRAFLAPNVPLEMGPNTISVVGRDRVGNSITTSVTVTRTAAIGPHIQLVSGNNQIGPVGSVVSSPLVVTLRDASGDSVANRQVIFKVVQNNGFLSGSSAGTPGETYLATSNGQGLAQAQWTLGMRSGAGGNTVEAYAVGFAGTAVFSATGTQALPERIVVDTGTNQIGATGQPLPKPFVAVVVDAGYNRLAGVPVSFTIRQGDGSFDGQREFTTTTDSDGRAAATLVLGTQEGNSNNVVEASFEQMEGPPAIFVASGRTPGDVTQTAISGVVLDNTNMPIAGVTVRAVLTDAINARFGVLAGAPAVQTDVQGQFRIMNAPVGAVELFVDGATAQRPERDPSLEYDFVTVAGHDNTVGMPIYLVPLNPDNTLCVTATSGGGTLTTSDAPGFSLTFAPGQVTFPGGSQSGCVSVTTVHADKVPMVPAFGQQPRFIVTVQPPNALFSPPAAVSFPNSDGLPPRTVTEMFSYDHDISAFVSIGTGVVSEDGQVVRSSPGAGVIKSGWVTGGGTGGGGCGTSCGPGIPAPIAPPPPPSSGGGNCGACNVTSTGCDCQCTVIGLVGVPSTNTIGVNKPVTLTAEVTNQSSSPIAWSVDSTPSQSVNGSLVTSFASAGEHTITATCGLSSRTISVTAVSVRLRLAKSEQFAAVSQNYLPDHAGSDPIPVVMTGVDADGRFRGQAQFEITPSTPAVLSRLVAGLGRCDDSGASPTVLFHASNDGQSMSFEYLPNIVYPFSDEPQEFYPLIGLDLDGDQELDGSEVIPDCGPMSFRFRLVSQSHSDHVAGPILATLGVARLAGYRLSADFMEAYLNESSAGGTESEEDVSELSSLYTLGKHVGVRWDGAANLYKLRRIAFDSGSALAGVVRRSDAIRTAIVSTFRDYCSQLSPGTSSPFVSRPLNGGQGANPRRVHFLHGPLGSVEDDLAGVLGAAEAVAPDDPTGSESRGVIGAAVRRTAAGIELNDIRLQAAVVDIYDWNYGTAYPPVNLPQWIDGLLGWPVDIQANYRGLSSDRGGVFRTVIDVTGAIDAPLVIPCD